MSLICQNQQESLSLRNTDQGNLLKKHQSLPKIPNKHDDVKVKKKFGKKVSVPAPTQNDQIDT